VSIARTPQAFVDQAEAALDTGSLSDPCLLPMDLSASWDDTFSRMDHLLANLLQTRRSEGRYRASSSGHDIRRVEAASAAAR
jgi:hypothetical protein